MNLSDNTHLKECENALDNWDINKGWMYCNDIGGVDFTVDINIKDLNLDTEDLEEIEEILENYYENSDYYFTKEHGTFKLVHSTSEEIFITFENELVFPDNERIKLDRDDPEIVTITHILGWLEDNDIGGGVYRVGYYGDCTPYKYWETEEYKTLSNDEKTRKKEIETLTSIVSYKRDLETHTSYAHELPDEFYNELPNYLKEISDQLEVIEIVDFTKDSLTIKFDLDYLDVSKESVLKYLNESEELFLSTTPNSLKFIKGELEWDIQAQ